MIISKIDNKHPIKPSVRTILQCLVGAAIMGYMGYLEISGQTYVPWLLKDGLNRLEMPFITEPLWVALKLAAQYAMIIAFFVYLALEKTSFKKYQIERKALKKYKGSAKWELVGDDLSASKVLFPVPFSVRWGQRGLFVLLAFTIALPTSAFSDFWVGAAFERDFKKIENPQFAEALVYDAYGVKDAEKVLSIMKKDKRADDEAAEHLEKLSDFSATIRENQVVVRGFEGSHTEYDAVAVYTRAIIDDQKDVQAVYIVTYIPVSKALAEKGERVLKPLQESESFIGSLIHMRDDPAAPEGRNAKHRRSAIARHIHEQN